MSKFTSPYFQSAKVTQPNITMESASPVQAEIPQLLSELQYTIESQEKLILDLVSRLDLVCGPNCPQPTDPSTPKAAPVSSECGKQLESLKLHVITNNNRLFDLLSRLQV